MNKFKSHCCILLFLGLGLILFCYPMMINSNYMFGDLGDVRLINYIFEHYYLWIIKANLHTSFWDMPFFYPLKNTLAFSDVLMGQAFIYAIIRFFVKSAQTSLQISFVIFNILNFLSFYLLSKKIFKFNTLYSSICAYIFAFNLIRHINIFHIQFYSQYLSIFSLLFLLSINKKNSQNKNLILFSLGYSFYILQLYTSFYLAWFDFMIGVLTISVLLIFKNTRKKVIEYFSNYKLKIIAAFILLTLTIFPLAIRYLSLDIYTFDFGGIEKLKIKTLLSSKSLIDKFIFELNPKGTIESFAGIGYFTTLFILLGLMNFKYKFQVIIISVITYLFLSNENLLLILHYYIPGGSVIRSPERAVLIFIPLYSYLITNFLKNCKHRLLLYFCLALIMIEQISYSPNYNWTKEIHNKRINSYKTIQECPILYFEINPQIDIKHYIEYMLDAMFVSDIVEKPTLNGYSGYIPNYRIMDFPSNCVIKIDKE